MEKSELQKKLESIEAGIKLAPANAKPMMQKAIDNIKMQIAELESKKEEKPEGRSKGRPKGTTKPKVVKAPAKRGRKPKEEVAIPVVAPITETQVNKMAKEIKEEGEPMIKARKRAKKVLTEIKEVAKETKKVSETKGGLTKAKIMAEIKKLNKVFANLGIDIQVDSADDLFRDATRTALPKGWRTSKNGNEYYENRPNRSDSLQGTPVYPKLKLAEGGMMERGGEVRYQLAGKNFSDQIENGRKFKELINKAYESQTSEHNYPENFIKETAFTGKIVKSDGEYYLKDYTYRGTLTKFDFLGNKYFLEALKYLNRPTIKNFKFAEGGMTEGMYKIVDVDDNIVETNLTEQGVIDFANTLGYYDAEDYSEEPIDDIESAISLIEMEGDYKVEEKFAEGGSIPKSYTHFVVRKSDGKIINGYDYKGVDKEDISYFTKDDFKDMGISLKEFSLLTKQSLMRNGIDPFDDSNWTNQYANGGMTYKMPEEKIYP